MVNVGLRGYLWERKSVQHKVSCSVQDGCAQLHLQCLCLAWLLRSSLTQNRAV